jgi:2-C-methyl-D-erythritol 2,4-cyclodiphosphate synthase
VFLEEARRLAAERGWEVGNVDATVILERPKIGARKDEMRANIGAALGIGVERVGLKGKTHEGVDAVGEGRAIEVHAVALLWRK